MCQNIAETTNQKTALSKSDLERFYILQRTSVMKFSTYEYLVISLGFGLVCIKYKQPAASCWQNQFLVDCSERFPIYAASIWILSFCVSLRTVHNTSLFQWKNKSWCFPPSIH